MVVQDCIHQSLVPILPMPEAVVEVLMILLVELGKPKVEMVVVLEHQEEPQLQTQAAAVAVLIITQAVLAAPVSSSFRQITHLLSM